MKKSTIFLYLALIGLLLMFLSTYFFDNNLVLDVISFVLCGGAAIAITFCKQ